ncbi:MAG: aspartate carbamoyltransferase [Nanoarchaeales archaeon]|nr:aspartate carbamoyltransferase [Nanoarchaeales archaeon]
MKKENPKKNIILSQQFSIEFLNELFKLTDFMKQNETKVSEELRGKIVSLLFYESSTRTRFSFESAVLKLGGNCITTENAAQFSSASKGETLEDSIRMVSTYCDFIILRHNEDNSSKRAVSVASVPVINAGSGKSQHPTQALLDLYTIYEEFGTLENMKFAIVGDLLRGRTCDSLVYLLSKFKGNEFFFVSPDNSKIKESLKNYLVENNLNFSEVDNLDDVLPAVDVCYMTRIQKERFESLVEYEKTKGLFILDKENVELMKDNAIIMHPLPRVDEITLDVDMNKRARYFEQAKNGLYVRMAILKLLNDNV